MPEIVYNVKFRIKQEQIGKQGVADITRYEETIERLKNTINKQAIATGAAVRSNKSYVMSMKGVSQMQGNANKQVAIGNQLFFSLSDGIQDSAQFSQGFAQGMRAVGNNIGFTAELMGSFIQRTKEMNNGVLSGSAVMAGLRQSFLGVGGIIFAINTAVTVLTVFGDRLFRTKKDVDELADTINSLARSEYKNYIDANITLENELKVLQKVLGDTRSEEQRRLDQLLENAKATQDNRRQIRALSADQFNAMMATRGMTSAVQDQTRQANAQQDQLNEISALQAAIASAEKVRETEVRDAIRKVLVDRVAEIEVTKLLQQAYEELGLQASVTATDLSPFIKELAQIEQRALGARNSFTALNFEVDAQNKRFNELLTKYPELRAEIDRASRSFNEYSEMQRMAIGAQAISGLAQAAGQFGEIFNASKEFRLAMATVDAIAAVISTFATVPFPANIATAAGIAASLAAQIKNIRDTTIGSPKTVGKPVSSSASQVQRTGFYTESSQRPSYSPSRNDMKSQVNITATAKIDKRGLALLVRDGEGALQSSAIISTSA